MVSEEKTGTKMAVWMCREKEEDAYRNREEKGWQGFGVFFILYIFDKLLTSRQNRTSSIKQTQFIQQ